MIDIEKNSNFECRFQYSSNLKSVTDLLTKQMKLVFTCKTMQFLTINIFILSNLYKKFYSLNLLLLKFVVLVKLEKHNRTKTSTSW